MLRQVKPRTARSKRALEKRAPKVNENPKTALFLRGTTCSQVTQDAMQDLYSLRQTHAKRFHKKNPVHPFEDASSLTFFSEKNDTSLILFGSSSKKRPHTITFCRTFDYKMLDMLEFYLDPETFRSIAQFKTKKVPVGTKPLMVFAGTAFESPVPNAFTTAKSMLIDFFRGEPSDKIDVEGLQYCVVVSADEPTSSSTDPSDPSTKPTLHLRAYLIRTKRSGQKLPRVEVEEHGPRMDFRLGRLQQPDADMLKAAMRKPKTNEERTKKNISMDSIGDKIGRIHMGKLDLSELQTRKMKGLKRSRDVVDEDFDDADMPMEGVKEVSDRIVGPRKKKARDVVEF
ncbi:Brix-domain-containing protein [Neurospora crassa]|uniref:Ribosome production factor 2 homolog n=1 Tax=Neurospora crassa (strain ATCC 24698 / 74-OR23-1A / CBS 708.71 / DSM 1257 / FGSC 987) TaxID=367110 RepID=Q7SCN3_NEUCR|nr:ribosome biogenesis protein [Neurospora crassa OR74A]EAA34504.1 ribosome biogenesis protein [Neurospora crassa OR74A]KHE78332.1 Brix-domain-containing protein [Neurospora crassa]|eukprot:XP_963740.1 ribosome biogenesis protein [Neurospora crassa OR74A]